MLLLRQTVLVGGILPRTTAPAARKVQTPCSAAGQCRNTATRSLTRDVLESVIMPTLSLVKDSLVKMIQQGSLINRKGLDVST